MCVSTWNVAVIKRWVEVSSPEEISQAINIPSPVGTALCMAAAIRKDHEKGNELYLLLSKLLHISIMCFYSSSVLFFVMQVLAI